MGVIEARFAARIKAIRHALNWSAQSLADRIEPRGSQQLTRVAISKIECGARHISLDEAVALCETLGVSLTEMISPEPVKFELRTEVLI